MRWALIFFSFFPVGGEGGGINLRNFYLGQVFFNMPIAWGIDLTQFKLQVGSVIGQKNFFQTGSGQYRVTTESKTGSALGHW